MKNNADDTLIIKGIVIWMGGRRRRGRQRELNAVLQRRAARRRDPKRARDSIFPLLVVSTWTCCVRHGSPLVIPLILMCPILN